MVGLCDLQQSFDLVRLCNEVLDFDFDCDAAEKGQFLRTLLSSNTSRFIVNEPVTVSGRCFKKGYCRLKRPDKENFLGRWCYLRCHLYTVRERMTNRGTRD